MSDKYTIYLSDETMSPEGAYRYSYEFAASVEAMSYEDAVKKSKVKLKLGDVVDKKGGETLFVVTEDAFMSAGENAMEMFLSREYAEDQNYEGSRS